VPIGGIGIASWAWNRSVQYCRASGRILGNYVGIFGLVRWIKIGYGKYHASEALMVIIVGTALAGRRPER
jgi:hypothetical protein